MTIPDKMFATYSWQEINVYMFAKRNTKDGSLQVSLQQIADEFGTTRGKVRHLLDKFYNENLLIRTASAQHPHSTPSETQAVTIGFRTASAQHPHSLADLNIRKNLFIERLKPYLEKYGREMLNDFYQYWTQVNDGGHKMLFERQKAFQIPNRLATWHSKNYQRYNNNERKQQEQQERIAGYADIAAGFRAQAEGDIAGRYNE